MENNNIPSSRGARYSRREFLIRSGLVGAGALSLPAILAACGGGSSGGDEGYAPSRSSGGSRGGHSGHSGIQEEEIPF